jgi:two-component system sensor histidine kinase KdpD
VAATSSAVITTAALARLGADATIAGMIFLVLVVWTATQAGIRLSLCIAILCALSFDYFFLPPYHTLVLAGSHEWVAVFAFVASSLVAGRVAERARQQARQAEQRREDVERLYTLSQEMMLHENAAGLIRDLPGILERIFMVECVVLYVHDQDLYHSSIEDLSEMVKAGLREMTTAHKPSHEVPDGFEAQALMLGLRPVGALAWRPALLSREVATAVSAQVAIALTRAIAIEANARMEASREGERLRVALIDSLTHELRTPLTSIRAAATTLMAGEGLDDAARTDLAAVVDEEASRLDTLIGEAVEMAEIDANVVQIHAVPEHTRTLLEHAVEESQAALARHHVVIAVEEPDNPAWFDPQLLGRVFRHLIENAARYSPVGSRIALRSRRIDGRLEFLVEDDGPGIDSADLPLIFEKFYRGKKSAAKGKGTGMGLAIARAILIAHGGSIEAISRPGQGATFRFWVPLVEKEPPNSDRT